MIGLGAKYLTAAGFGRYRITAASLGSNLMFGSLWLNYAAQQAIMDAFGVDGPAVIAATNEYLNGIAASDKAKATALAALINEDPMMVCSLGLSVEGVTMPERSLKGDGTAYINTLYNPNDQTIVESKIRYSGWHNHYDKQFGVDKGGASIYIYSQINSNGGVIRYVFGPNSTTYGKEVNANDGQFHTIRLKRASVVYDGTIYTFASCADFTMTAPMFIYGCNNQNSNVQQSSSYVVYFRMYEGDVAKREMLPMRLGKAWSADKVSTGVAQAKDTLGMIDLVTGIFYPNAASSGAFTMEGEPTP